MFFYLHANSRKVAPVTTTPRDGGFLMKNLALVTRRIEDKKTPCDFYSHGGFAVITFQFLFEEFPISGVGGRNAAIR